MNLTDEQLNIEICKWLGWTQNEHGYWYGPDFSQSQGGIRTERLPSHLLGIEALGNMHAAEKGMTLEQIILYRDYLDENEETMCVDWALVHATARQRVIALLRIVKPELFAKEESK